MDTNFNEAIKKVNEALMNAPLCLSVQLVFENGKNYYAFVDNTTAGKKARKEVQKLLSDMWQGGAYNYAEIARYLRVQELDIQAVLDEDFQKKKGLSV